MEVVRLLGMPGDGYQVKGMMQGASRFERWWVVEGETRGEEKREWEGWGWLCLSFCICGMAMLNRTRNWQEAGVYVCLSTRR